MASTGQPNRAFVRTLTVSHSPKLFGFIPLREMSGTRIEIENGFTGYNKTVWQNGGIFTRPRFAARVLRETQAAQKIADTLNGS